MIFPQGTFSEVNLPQLGYEFNQPLIFSQNFASEPLSTSYFKVNSPNIMVEVVKRAEGPLENDVTDKGDANVVVRLWETMGGRGTSSLSVWLPIKQVTRYFHCFGLTSQVQLIRRKNRRTRFENDFVNWGSLPRLGILIQTVRNNHLETLVVSYNKTSVHQCVPEVR